jgi:hypothetical protein
MDERAVTAEQIADARQHPLHRKPTKTDELGRRSYQQIGRDATIVVNPDTGNLITTWRTGSRTRRRYERNGNRGIDPTAEGAPGEP